MSDNHGYLALRLQGPLMSWGYDSQFDYRKTGLMPTKSALAGMCCAALGYSRGTAEESSFLEKFRKLKMLSIAVPRQHPMRDDAVLDVRRLRDYHTVQGTRKASGGTKNSHLTYRYYLQDAAFAVVLSGGRGSLRRIAEALQNPVWGLWLGRKACIPTAPVFAGLYDIQEEALESLIGDSSSTKFTFQEEVSLFAEGDDTLPDQPVCFGSADKDKEYAPRRIRTRQAGEK